MSGVSAQRQVRLEDGRKFNLSIATIDEGEDALLKVQLEAQLQKIIDSAKVLALNLSAEAGPAVAAMMKSITDLKSVLRSAQSMSLRAAAEAVRNNVQSLKSAAANNRDALETANVLLSVFERIMPSDQSIIKMSRTAVVRPEKALQSVPEAKTRPSASITHLNFNAAKNATTTIALSGAKLGSEHSAVVVPMVRSLASLIQPQSVAQTTATQTITFSDFVAPASMAPSSPNITPFSVNISASTMVSAAVPLMADAAPGVLQAASVQTIAYVATESAQTVQQSYVADTSSVTASNNNIQQATTSNTTDNVTPQVTANNDNKSTVTNTLEVKTEAQSLAADRQVYDQSNPTNNTMPVSYQVASLQSVVTTPLADNNNVPVAQQPQVQVTPSPQQAADTSLSIPATSAQHAPQVTEAARVPSDLSVGKYEALQNTEQKLATPFANTNRAMPVGSAAVLAETNPVKTDVGGGLFVAVDDMRKESTRESVFNRQVISTPTAETAPIRFAEVVTTTSTSIEAKKPSTSITDEFKAEAVTTGCPLGCTGQLGCCRPLQATGDNPFMSLKS